MTQMMTVMMRMLQFPAAVCFQRIHGMQFSHSMSQHLELSLCLGVNPMPGVFLKECFTGRKQVLAV